MIIFVFEISIQYLFIRSIISFQFYQFQVITNFQVYKRLVNARKYYKLLAYFLGNDNKHIEQTQDMRAIKIFRTPSVKSKAHKLRSSDNVSSSDDNKTVSRNIV